MLVPVFGQKPREVNAQDSGDLSPNIPALRELALPGLAGLEQRVQSHQ
jgi:hypothetical protein